MKKLLFVLVAIAVIIGILSAIAPNEYSVERNLEINAPASLIYDQVARFENTQKWSPWSKLDPNQSSEIVGEDGTVGAVYKWSGNEDVGTGEQEIVDLVPNKSVKHALRFIEPWEAQNDAWINLNETENGAVNVSWGFSGESGFPMDIMMWVMDIDASVGADYQKGLENLKELCESAAADMSAAPSYEIEVMSWEPKYMLAVRDTVKIADNGPFMQASFPKLYEEMGKSGIAPSGSAYGIYWMWDEENGTTDMAVATTVEEGTEAPEGLMMTKIEGENAVSLTHVGPYSGLMMAHQTLGMYMEENELEFKGPAIEEYVTDMRMEPDSTKWVTKLYYLY